MSEVICSTTRRRRLQRGALKLPAQQLRSLRAIAAWMTRLQYIFRSCSEDKHPSLSSDHFRLIASSRIDPEGLGPWVSNFSGLDMPGMVAPESLESSSLFGDSRLLPTGPQHGIACLNKPNRVLGVYDCVTIWGLYKGIGLLVSQTPVVSEGTTQQAPPKLALPSDGVEDSEDETCLSCNLQGTRSLCSAKPQCLADPGPKNKMSLEPKFPFLTSQSVSPLDLVAATSIGCQQHDGYSKVRQEHLTVHC